MKLSFTTLGCPDWDLNTILTQAKQYGFQGVDFRGYQGTMNIYECPEFSDHIQETLEKFKKSGLQVSCFSSSVQLVSSEKSLQYAHEIKEYVRLCKLFGTRYIRVFGGSIGNMDRAEAKERAIEHMRQYTSFLQGSDIQLILETHDDWTACGDVASILNEVDDQAAGVLWDVHHPYRTLAEDPQETWDVLGRRIAYTHWKDSHPIDRDPGFEYCFMGEGDIPLQRIYSILSKNHYDGWFTLEWEKRWHPELQEPQEAFPQYVEYMRHLKPE